MSSPHHRFLTSFLPQYGVQLPGESFVRLQPSYAAAVKRAEATLLLPGEQVPVLVYNLETGQWQLAGTL